MKRSLLILASAALLLAGCAKEKFANSAEGGLQEVTFTTSLATDRSKAIADNDGNGAKVNRCIMEIYFQDELYKRLVEQTNSGVATFANVPVVAGKEYQILFWADCGGAEKADKYYTTTDLKTVTVAKDAFIGALKAGKNDELDAFFFADNYTVPQAGGNYTAKLKRPFAQLNVITTDVGANKTVVSANLLPETVSVSYTAGTAFNVADSTVTGSTTYAYSAPVYGTWSDTKTELTLSMDYILATNEQGAVDVAFSTSTGMAHSLTNLPYKRNYRTNVKGELLTTNGTWNAEIKPAWNTPDEEVKFVEAGSVAAANEAFANGATSVKITSVGEETNLYLPQTTKEVTIDFANPSEVITVKYRPVLTKAVGDKPAVVNIATNDVTKFTVSGISNIVWLVGNQATLANALNNAVAGQTVALANDIDLDGITWDSPVLYADFNGNGHIIKNIKNPNCTPDYAGLFKVSYSNIKNVTIQNAEFAYGETMNARGGALVGDMRRGSIENCHVDGIKFDGYQKVGGLVGFLSKNADNGSDISIKNCSVKNATFAACGADDKYLYQTGGLIGYIQLGNRNISISNCSVNHIIFDNTKHNGVYNVASDNSGYLSHTFVGIIFSDTNNAANTLSFTANTISGENTQLNANMYGSAYFGWARNPEYKPTETVTLGKITIDGEEWTPNYPFKNVTTGKGYATLDAALTALKASETLEIWQAGEYTVETLTTPANTTIDAKVDGVVFNHTAAGYARITSDSNNNVTVKNVTWNVGVAGYQYYSGTNLENCKVVGSICLRTYSTFNNCEFYNADDYNFWEYGSGSTFTGCKFTCPGGTKGGAVNAYNEGEHGLKKVVFKNCEFVALNESSKYAAVYIKPESSFDIEFTNCTANDKFCTGDKSGSKLWNVKDHSNLNTKVTVDGQLVYANGTVLAISTPAQLKNFADAVNSGKSFKGLTAFLASDIDLAGETVTPIGAGDKKFDGTFDGKGKTISNLEINGSSNGTALFGHVWEATIKNLKITNAKVTNTALDYTGILAGNGYANISGCDINGTVEGQEQVGAIIGYLSCGSIMNCKVDATVKGTSRVGVLCAKANVDSQYKIEGNTIKGSATSDDIYAGGVVGQIMCGTGKVWTIKNNSIDATVSTGGSLIGNVRSGNWDAFVAGYQTNVTGNTWTAAGNCKITDGNPEHSVEISK